MITLGKMFLTRHSTACFFICLLLTICTAGTASATPQAESTDQKSEIAGQPPVIPENKGTFEYLVEDRADPFVPFLTEKLPELDPNEIITSDQPHKQLTGMQIFEPGQLTLVALLQQEGHYIAMVEDFNGKGYILEEGIKIGRRGVVRSIVSNKVIIEETAKTRSGKTLTSDIVMVLKKEGEE